MCFGESNFNMGVSPENYKQNPISFEVWSVVAKLRIILMGDLLEILNKTMYRLKFGV